jgi:hypothetical protein
MSGFSRRPGFVSCKQLAASERPVRTLRLDAGFFKVGAGLRHVAALQHRDRLAFEDLLAGRNLQIEQTSAQRGENMHQTKRIGFHSSEDAQRVVDRLSIDGLHLKVCLGLLRGLWWGGVPAAGQGQRRPRDDGCIAQAGEMDSRGHGTISVCAA